MTDEIPPEIPGEIRARLEAAEMVCTLFSWTAYSTDSPEGKALFQLWRRWLQVSGVSVDPADHPELSHVVINDLAAEYDGKRTRTLTGDEPREDQDNAG
jgi:hypothetical protein